MSKVSFHNLGCKVNSYEIDAMIKQFIDHGFELVSFDEPADVCIINTCSVTSIADRKSRQMLHRAKKLSPNALVVAVGCYVQADPNRALADEAVDLIIGNEQKSKVYDLVEARLNNCTDISKVDVFDDIYSENFNKNFRCNKDIDDNVNVDIKNVFSQFDAAGDGALRTRAFIKIQDGCNQFCSYCLIPYLRGCIRSRDKDSILKEVEELYNNGCREVVLTGIHLSSYGLKSTEKFDGTRSDALIDIIKETANIMKDGRIRLGSLEPRIITSHFVDEISKIKNLCPHFHLSLQSGCDETLKRMNRHYTTQDYKDAVELLRQTFKHPAITTDVIVGFPGETDEEFKTTCKFLEEINLYEMHIFKYSVREGTVAAKLQGQISPEIQEERSNILLAMTKKHKEVFASYYLGKDVEILIEEEVVGALVGYNPEYVKFKLPLSAGNIGEIVHFSPKNPTEIE